MINVGFLPLSHETFKTSEKVHTFFQLRSILALGFSFGARNPSVGYEKVDTVLLLAYLSDEVF